MLQIDTTWSRNKQHDEVCRTECRNKIRDKQRAMPESDNNNNDS